MTNQNTSSDFDPAEKYLYEASDLYEAAALYASKRKLKRIVGGRSFIFYFEDSLSCQRIIKAFYCKELALDPLSFAEAHRSLKLMMKNLGSEAAR